MYMKGEKIMGSAGAARTGAGRGTAAGGRRGGAPAGYRPMTAAERRERVRATGSSPRYIATGEVRGVRRNVSATPTRTGAVSAEEFERATGVNPRTGRRTRRRRG